MATKWEINNAVKRSGLPAPSRLIMFVLSDVADAQTGIIPDEHTPALREIAEWTGLHKSTVIRHLDLLDSAGWVIRDRPDVKASRNEHVRTAYRLNVGGAQSDTARGAQSDTEDPPEEPDEPPTVVQPAPSQSGNVGQGMVQSATPRGAQSDTARGAQSDTSLFHDHYDQKPSSSSAKPPKAKPTTPPERSDIDKICQHLADRIEANGSLRPTITAKWRTEARLLLDRDGRTVEQVLKCIDWCQNDEFWRANIRSMPKLRKQYDTLRLHAMRANGRATPARASPLVEHNGMLLKPETIADIERTKRFEALDAQDAAGQQPAIGGPA